MKKIRVIFSVLGMCFLFIRNGNALPIPDYTPLIPVAPQICAQCTPAAIGKVTAGIQMVMSVKDDFESGKLLSKVKQFGLSYAMTLGSTAFNRLKKDLLKQRKVVSYARTIEECNIGGDMTDEAKVKDAFIKLFLQYPSDKGPEKKAYRNKGDQMKMDTNVEMYVTAVEMSKELDGMLAELDNIEKCIVAGEDCSSVGMESYNCQTSETEDDACLWRNALVAVRIYDKIMQYNEFLLAMKVQLDAVRSIGGNVKIREFEKKEDKTSLLNILNDRTEVQTATIEHKNSYGYASASDNKFGFATVKSAGLKKPLDGKEDDFMSLTVIKDAQEKINEAMSAHNYKKMLPDFKKSFEDYHAFNKYYQIVMDNLYLSDVCSVNYLGQYYVDGLKAWLGRRCEQTEKRFKCEYREQDDAHLGEYDVACSNNANNKCFILNQDDFNVRLGISAWLMELYEEANVEENNSSEDIYMTMSMSNSDSSSLQSLDDAKSSSNSKYKNDSSGDGEPNLKKPSMEDDLYAEMRKNSLLTWTLGAKVAQEVAADLVEKDSKFGRTKSLPLWNDQKAFYDIYIDGKYKNIRDYIEKMPLFSEMAGAALVINQNMVFEDIKNAAGEIISSGEEKRAELKQNIQKLQNILSNGGGKMDTSKLDDMLAEESKALNEIRSDYLKLVDAKEKEKAKIYEQLDKLSEELSNVRDEIEQAANDTYSSESMVSVAEEGLLLGKKYKRGNSVSPQEKMFSQQKTEGNELNVQAISKKDSGAIREKTLTENIKRLRERLDSLEGGMIAIDADYVKKYSDKEALYKQKVSGAVNSVRTVAKISEIENIISLTPPLKISEIITEAVRKYALGLVDETVEKINSLKSGNKLYYAANSSEIYAIHNEMIQKLKNITLNDLLLKALLPEEIQKLKITEDFLEPFKSSFAKLLEGKDTPDSEYFVGLIARDRDFMAPKAPVKFQSASLRDVFHLDQDDFFSIKQFYKGNKEELPEKNKDVTISRRAVLDSGLDLPEIWRYILQNRTFVEQDIDMKDLLNSGTPGLALVNRGIYPCKDVKTGKSIAMNGLDRFVVTSDSGKQYCSNVKLDNNKIYDIEGNAYYDYSEENVGISNDTSELGQILDFVTVTKTVCEEGADGLPECKTVIIEEKLTFRQELLDAVRILVNLPNRDMSEEKKDAANVLYKSVLFERNQYGDFLDMVDQVKMAKEMRNSLENGIQEVRQQLKSIFEELGFTFDDNFDLSIEEDYKEAQDVLDEQKEGYIKAAKRIMTGISGKSDRIMADTAKLNHQLKLLEKDNEELILISGSEDLDDFEENLRTEIANRGVAEEYTKEGDKSFTNNLKRLRPPYCSVY